MKRNTARCKYHDDLPNLCYHCMKCVQIRIFLWSVFTCLSEYGKIRTRKKSVFENFSHCIS